MDFKLFLADKNLKAKQKVEALAAWILANPENFSPLIAFAKTAKDPEKGTAIEAFEFATRTNLAIGTAECFDFAVSLLAEKAPRVKWEAAKVLGNIAKQHTGNLDEALVRLLDNTEFPGTVVRWSAAFALGEIVKLNTAHNADLVPAIKSICENEAENSIRKIYLAALKKLNQNQ